MCHTQTFVVPTISTIVLHDTIDYHTGMISTAVMIFSSVVGPHSGAWEVAGASFFFFLSLLAVLYV